MYFLCLTEIYKELLDNANKALCNLVSNNLVYNITKIDISLIL